MAGTDASLLSDVAHRRIHHPDVGIVDVEDLALSSAS
jgi:hypothetical protein